MTISTPDSIGEYPTTLFSNTVREFEEALRGAEKAIKLLPDIAEELRLIDTAGGDPDPFLETIGGAVASLAEVVHRANT